MIIYFIISPPSIPIKTSAVLHSFENLGHKTFSGCCQLNIQSFSRTFFLLFVIFKTFITELSVTLVLYVRSLH